MSDSAGNMCIPFVGGIIERKDENGTIWLLIQTRQQARVDSIYNGTFEFAAGKLDKPYENVYKALEREIYEETGLKLKNIINDSKTQEFSPHEVDLVFGFRPFCCTQQLKNGRPWIGFIFRCEVEAGEPLGRKGET